MYLIPSHSLNFFILLGISNFYVILRFLGLPYGKRYMMGLIGIIPISLVLFYVIDSNLFKQIHFDFSIRNLLVSIGVGSGVLAVELVCKWVNDIISSRHLVSLKLDLQWRYDFVHIAMILVISVLEEVYFRYAFYHIMVINANMPWIIYILFSGGFFGLNHFQSKIILIQKSMTGMILAAVFVLTGYNMLVVIAAHITENIWIIVLSNRSNQTGGCHRAD